jgi:uncharacterized protein YecT (DUF1311 family)
MDRSPVRGDNAVMNHLVLTVLLLVIPTSAPSQSRENPCWKTAVAQSEMNRCADRDARRADAELNRVYQELLSKNKDNANATRKLRAAQRAWLAFRDAQLQAQYPAEDKQGEYGSIYPMCYAIVATAMTKERTAQLRRMLQDKDPCDIGD